MDEPKDSFDEAPAPRPGKGAKPVGEREARLAAALRANLKRRKAASRPAGS
jgi:hypothetical protein